MAEAVALQDMPGHLIRRAHQISNAIFAEECGAFDLTSVQYAALVAIEAHDGIDATRLSGVIAFDRSTIGDVLERMEAKGWIVRRSGPSDKRIKRLHASDAGKALLRQVAPAVLRVQHRLLAPIAAGDRDAMLDLLRLVANVAAPSQADPARATEGRVDG